MGDAMSDPTGDPVDPMGNPIPIVYSTGYIIGCDIP